MSELNNSSVYTLQKGRSMIEMIGVLAIIGVLSIGGIAGYSKAMTKYKVNKTAEQIAQLAQGVRTMYLGQKRYTDLTPTVIKKAHIAPDEMYENATTTTLTNPFGGTVVIATSDKKKTNDQRAFTVTLSSVPQEVCIELLTQDWGTGSFSGLIALGEENTTKGTRSGCTDNTGQTHCSKAGTMGMAQATDICANLVNTITWKFY